MIGAQGNILMVRRRTVRTALFFAITGALGAVVSWLLFYFNHSGVLSLGLWPTSLLGMGLGELSGGFWAMLMLFNAMLFGVFGVLVGAVPPRLAPLAWISLVAVLLAWCAWGSGFELSISNVASTCGVLVFYSVPFLVIARFRTTTHDS